MITNKNLSLTLLCLCTTMVSVAQKPLIPGSSQRVSREQLMVHSTQGGESRFITTRMQDHSANRLSAPKRRSKPVGKAPMLISGDGTELWGGIVYADSWNATYWAGKDVPFGYYAFPASSQNFAFEPLYTDDNYLQPDGGAVLLGDTLHFVHDIYGYGTHYALYESYDVTTWTRLRSEFSYDYGISAFDLAYDPTSGKVYGEFSSSDNAQAGFGTIDYSTLTKSIITYMDTTFVGLACNSEGQLYGVNVDGNLYTIDKVNGSYKLVGRTGLNPSNYRQSATIDLKTDKMYFACQNKDNTSGLYEINTTTGEASLLQLFDDNQEICGLVIPYRGVVTSSPAKIRDFVAKFTEGSLTGTFTFTAPSTTQGGAALSGDLTYYIVANGDTIGKGQTTAGAAVATTAAVKAAGSYRLEVLTRNAAGYSQPARAQVGWAGYDTPHTDSVHLEIDKTSRQTTLSWHTPLKGIHGGYINPDKLRFDVYRLPGNVKVASQTADSVFTETLPEGERMLYSYAVVPFNDTLMGDTAYSAEKSLGSYYTVPYYEPFNTAATVTDLYTPFDNNHDGVTWTWNDGRASFSTGFNYGDDYLISPKIKLVSGRKYDLSFIAHGGYGHRLQVKFGAGDDPSKRSQYRVIIKTTELPNDQDTLFHYNLEVETEGEYQIAFRATSDPQKIGLTLDNVRISAGSSNAAPDTVRNLTVTPAAQGKLQATVSFTAPDKSISGESLSCLTSANIYRNNQFIGTVSNVAPGKEVTFTDNAPQNGFNHYAVAAVNGNGEGLKDSVTVYVGQDQPYSVRNVKYVDNLDGTATLTWDAPDTTGRNGGYVDAAKLTYYIYYNDYTDLAPVDTLSERSYTTTLRTTDFQSNVYFTVGVGNIAGLGDNVTSNVLVDGAPYELPFEESFPSGNYNTLWWVDTDLGTQGFRYDQSFSADNDNGCIYWYPSSNESDGAIFSGKIDIRNATRPTLKFYYYELPGFNGQLWVEVDQNLKHSTRLWNVDMKNLSGSGAWKEVTIDLTPYKDCDYAVLKFFATSSQVDGHGLYLDDIRVSDVLDHNVSLSLQAPKAATAGTATTLVAHVKNIGNNAESVDIKLNENGKFISDGNSLSLAAGQDSDVVITYQPSVAAGASAEVTLQAVVSDDMDEQDNTASATISLHDSQLPSPTGLTATAADGNSDVALSWTAPVAAGVHTVTDDFEDYCPWAINGIGLWTVEDEDGRNSYGFQQQFLHCGTPYAFIVTNPEEIGADVTQDALKGLAPHSGSQYLTSFSAIGAQSSDWLISPQLSGLAQTISFYAKAISSSYSETFEVYADDQLLASVTADDEWTEYRYDLPAGTSHFRIHYTGYDKFGLMIDDATYSDGTLTVTGYNVYRDGELAATVPATTTSWTDAAHADAQHSYTVTAVYGVGESAPSAAATFTTGISSAVVDAATVTARYNVAGQRMDKAQHGVVIEKMTDGTVRKTVRR